MSIAPEKTITLLNTLMHRLSMQETLDIIHQRLETGEFTQHAVVNTAKLVNIQKDRKLKVSVEECDIINIDGMGVVWGARIMGLDVPERVAGIDLFLQLIALSAREHYPVFLLGATTEIVDTTAAELIDQHPQLNIAGTHHGYFWDDEQQVVEKIRGSGAKLLFVAITSPKKENFIQHWKHELGVDFVMGVGGTYDVVAGKVNRAPAWMQKFGLEWFYRVVQEPRRMWRRYLITNTMFIWLIFKQLLTGRVREK
jgi:N-acetylglucosaminyldiphosphoundecaprenol N-acetyl-beta-D-mannosaminyltransferase